MTIVSYRYEDPVATITMDDGKVNALSLAMLGEINRALDQAESAGAVVVITGRDGRFSGGFDLATLHSGGPDALTMLRDGLSLAERLLTFPTPVVVACSGHAIAMAAFLLLSCDYRIGAAGPFKITANEVAIGLPVPLAAIEICRQRLTPVAFNRAVILSEVFSPDAAVDAGFLDRVVSATELADHAQRTAVELSALDMRAHAATKLSVRAQALDALRSAIERDTRSPI